MFPYFFLHLNPCGFPLLGMADVLMFQLDRVNDLFEVRVCSLDVDNISHFEFPFCELNNAYAEMGIVVSDPAD